MSSGNVVCSLCQKSTRPHGTMVARALGPSLRAAIDKKRKRPLLDGDRICRECVLETRSEMIVDALAAQRGALSAVEKEVAEKAASHEAVASHLESELAGQATAGQRLADSVARVGGSWAFVITFVACLIVWMAINAVALRGEAFDPYPFILLNLVLSCLAALQAPIIMMSQNRASARDRMQADQDFRVNLKAEIEIAGLHEKVDFLLHEQFQGLLAVQQAQLEMMNELGEQLRTSRRSSNPPSSPE